MKKITKNIMFLLLASVVMMSFTFLSLSGIKGTITPAESAGDVWAISGTDSLKTTPAQGVFSFANAKPGTYKIIVEAKSPYKTFIKEGVEVKDGETADLGTITLEQ